MKLQRDTQLAIRWQIAPERLPPLCADLVLDANNSAPISRISLWEIAIKYGMGKLLASIHRAYDG